MAIARAQGEYGSVRIIRPGGDLGGRIAAGGEVELIRFLSELRDPGYL